MILVISFFYFSKFINCFLDLSIDSYVGISIEVYLDKTLVKLLDCSIKLCNDHLRLRKKFTWHFESDAFIYLAFI